MPHINGIIPSFLSDFSKYHNDQGNLFFNKANNQSYLYKNSITEIICDKNFIADALETIIYFNMFCGKRLYEYTIKWALDTRMGLTELSGTYLLPSQLKQDSITTNTFLDKDASMSYSESCSIMLQNACVNPKYQQNKFKKIHIDYKNIKLSAFICYPVNYNIDNTSQCILFYNPNNKTIAEYMINSKAGVTLKNSIPQQAQQIKQLPLIMYDYINTGTNQKSYTPKATLKTIINSGEVVLNYAITNFETVHIYSEGLGYNIAAVSLQKYLQENNNINISRIHFYNVNNTNATSNELLTNYPNWFVYVLGYIVGFNIATEFAIKYLLDYGIQITQQVIDQIEQNTTEL
jgi:hypothetical protein